MTSFSTHAVCGPVIGSLVARDKGDFSNRTKCAGEQFANNVKYIGGSFIIGAGAGELMYNIINSPAKTAKVTKLFDKLVSKAPKSKIVDKLLKMPGKAKVLAAIGLPLIALGLYLNNKFQYNKGQIDQKYTDQAKIEENTKKNILA